MDERIDEFLKVVEQKLNGSTDFWLWDDLCGSLDQLCENKDQSDRLLAAYEEIKRKDRIAHWDSRFMEATISGGIEDRGPIPAIPYQYSNTTTSIRMPGTSPSTILTTPALKEAAVNIMNEAYKDEYKKTTKAR